MFYFHNKLKFTSKFAAALIPLTSLIFDPPDALASNYKTAAPSNVQSVFEKIADFFTGPLPYYASIIGAGMLFFLFIKGKSLKAAEIICWILIGLGIVSGITDFLDFFGVASALM